MNATRPALLREPGALPSLPWWLMMIAVLWLTLYVHWIAGIGLLALVIVQRARPLDFLTSYLMVVVAGSFMNYGSGTLTKQMTFFLIFLIFMLYCYVLQRRWDGLVFPKTPATKPMLLWLGLTVANFIRGMVIGNSPRYAGLELIACLALVSSLLMASRRATEHEIKILLFWMWIMSLGHFMLGAYAYSVLHMRTIGVFFEAVPGVVAMMMLNFALRESRRSRQILWFVAMAPLLLHQFLSFTRGYWLAAIFTTVFSIVVYCGRGEGVGARWKRSAIALSMLAGLAVLGILAAAATLGIGNVFGLAGTRIASSAGTEYTWVSSSNVVRLVEYFHVLDLVIEQPIFGHGLGYYFVVREPIGFTLVEQWFVHENYLLVTLKQGLVGLALWVWLLISLVRVGLRGINLPNLTEQSWCAGTAAIVVYCIVYSFVHFPLAEVNTTFTFALATGVAMGLTGTDTIAIRWKGRRTQPAGS